jgi:hypothetical protein
LGNGCEDGSTLHFIHLRIKKGYPGSIQSVRDFFLTAAEIEELRHLLTEGSPFLIDERRQRIEKIERLHDDPEITVSELAPAILVK